MKKATLIIPVYNEEKVITNCLSSLSQQTYKNTEVIVVDDGSTDSSVLKIEKFNVKLLKQNHKGPGNARNLGANHSTGDILVFVDADMTFEKNFIRDLVTPINEGKAIGTFSKNEYVTNKNNWWSICWNINRNSPRDKMIPSDYPDKAPVFRAILKEKFDEVSGFETSGDYTDDWSLSERLGEKSMLAPGAKYYHSNPSTIREVWKQTAWIGKNRFLTGNLSRKIKSLLVYGLPVSITVGMVKSILNKNPGFILFKILYDFRIFISVIQSFVGTKKFK